MRRLTRWLVFASRRWWLFVPILALDIVAFRVLFALEDRFEGVTGYPVLDTQNGLTVPSLVRQLPLYEGEALSAYLRFAAFDFVFPFVAALFLAVLWALLLSANDGRVARRLLRWNLPLLPFAATLFDWAENVSLLTAIGAEATPGQAVLNAVILFKQLKLAGLVLSSATTAVLVSLLIANRSSRAYRRYAGRRVADHQGPVRVGETEGGL